MRVLPILSRRLLEQSSSGEPILVFVTVTHPDLDTPIRLVVDGADYVVNGDTWNQSFFELDLLTDTEQPPSARFRFPNVDREAISLLRRVSGPCRVEFALLPASYFDLTVEPRTVLPLHTVIWDRAPAGSLVYRASSLFLTEITADQVQVEGTLRSWDYRQESWPDKRATQALLPGVFAQ
jgi:hypothetical protein